jgi:hypothetical protein
LLFIFHSPYPQIAFIQTGAALVLFQIHPHAYFRASGALSQNCRPTDDQPFAILPFGGWQLDLVL